MPSTADSLGGVQVQPMMEHQTGDVEFIRRERRVLLGNEPGLGKSRSAIEATRGGRTLIIAPAMSINGGTWRDELERWAGDDQRRYTVAPFTSLNVRGERNTMTRAVKPEYRGPWDSVVIDEAHYTKGRSTGWTIAVDKITRDAEIVVEMTGTPIPNWAHELFTILRVVWPEEAKRGSGKYGSFWRWAEAWFDCSPTKYSQGKPVAGELLGCTPVCLLRPSTDPCDHYHRFVRANLGSKYRRMLRDDCLDLPLLSEVSIECTMDPNQRRAYREMKRDFATSIDGTEVLAWNKGARHVMLDQITTSPWVLAQDGPARGGKFERLRFDLAGRARPTLVLAHYQPSVEGCADVARQVGARVGMCYGGQSSGLNARAVDDFKKGRLDVLAASLEMASESLTLTRADMAIFVETSYKPYRNTQARYRVHRIGQTRPVTLLNYVTPGTVDQGKRALLATKTDRQMRYLTAAEYLAIA